MMERNRSLDIAKGIAIILVVLGHSYSFSDWNYVLYFISGFYMPFFFIVSGILYGMRTPCVKDFRINLASKVKTLLIPYFAFEILFAIYLFLAAYLADGLTTDFIVSRVSAVLNLTGLQTTWFLPCLFLVQILFFVLSRAGKLPCVSTIIALMILGLLWPEPDGYFQVILRCFVALGFFGVGFYFNEWWRRKQNLFYVGFIAIVYCILSIKNGLVSLVSCTFADPILYVVTSVGGTFVLVQTAMRLFQSGKSTQVITILEYLGKNSIVVLCTHAFIIEVIRLLDYKLLGSFLPKLGYGEGFVFTAIVMILEIPILIIGCRYFPFLFGMRKKDYQR